MNIILIGAQGSGKGTQAGMLSRAFSVPHVASGDLFRALDATTELGKTVKQYLDRGDLVPDDLTVAMVLGRLDEPDCKNGVLLDGFPRKMSQANALDDGLRERHRSVDVVAYLEVPREVLLQRLSGRYICRAHQHVYNINSRPPKVAGICDIDGSELYQRSDDVGAAVEKRLNIFFNETIQQLDYYKAQNKLVVVNGNQDIEKVQQALVDNIKNHRPILQNQTDEK
ncbi:MAG TPA: adenylate kinase [Ktedonobacteraceae bacterium]|nr:adenylate kinase [Ktedonobacteraceae bacterium]